MNSSSSRFGRTPAKQGGGLPPRNEGVLGSDPVIGEGNAGIVAVAGRFLHRDIVYSQRDTRGPVALQLAGIVVVVDVQRLACEGFEGRSASI